MKDKIIELRLGGKSYKEIELELGCARSTISYHCKRLNLNTPIYKKINRDNIEINSSKGKYEKVCFECSLEFNTRFDSQIYCSRSCSAIHKSKTNYNEFINKWKIGLVSGGKGELLGHGCVSNHVRKYIFNKYDSKCSECGWGEVNNFTNTIPLEIEHIDGNSMNHVEENLTLLCPNCHSLTAGHSTSKGNGRRYYREQYHKNKNI